MKTFDQSLNREDVELRLIRALEGIYESEMIVIHRRRNKDKAFDIFLQKADKGATEFKANTRGKALSHSEAGDIIRLMWENSDIINVGLIHKEKNDGLTREFPYIIKKADRYYTLKKYNTSVTEKEVVDNVLRKLNKYKQDIESATVLSDIEDLG